MLDEIKKWFQNDWWRERGETGQHHLLVLLAATVPSGVLMWWAVDWHHGLFAALLGAVWWDGYYAGRERIFEKAAGDDSSGGRWRDWFWPTIAAVMAAAVGFGVFV